MDFENAERWVRLITGPASALVVLFMAAGLLAYWIDQDLQTGIDNQDMIIEAQKEQHRLDTAKLEVLKDIRDLLRFQNYDTPVQP